MKLSKNIYFGMLLLFCSFSTIQSASALAPDATGFIYSPFFYNLGMGGGTSIIYAGYSYGAYTNIPIDVVDYTVKVSEDNGTQYDPSYFGLEYGCFLTSEGATAWIAAPLVPLSFRGHSFTIHLSGVGFNSSYNTTFNFSGSSVIEIH